MAGYVPSLGVVGKSAWLPRLGGKHHRAEDEDDGTSTEGGSSWSEKMKQRRQSQTSSSLYQVSTPLRAEQIAALRQGQQESRERAAMLHEDIEGAHMRFCEGRRSVMVTRGMD